MVVLGQIHLVLNKGQGTGSAGAGVFRQADNVRRLDIEVLTYVLGAGCDRGSQAIRRFFAVRLAPVLEFLTVCCLLIPRYWNF